MRLRRLFSTTLNKKHKYTKEHINYKEANFIMDKIKKDFKDVFPLATKVFTKSEVYVFLSGAFTITTFFINYRFDEMKAQNNEMKTQNNEMKNEMKTQNNEMKTQIQQIQQILMMKRNIFGF